MIHYRELTELGLVVAIQASDGRIEDLTRQIQCLARDRTATAAKRANLMREWHLRKLQQDANNR